MRLSNVVTVFGALLFLSCAACAGTIGLGNWIVTDAGDIDSRYPFHTVTVAQLESKDVMYTSRDGQSHTVTVRWIDYLSVYANQKVDLANEVVSVRCTDDDHPACMADLINE